MITRRKFIATTSLSAMAIAMMPGILAQDPTKRQIGLQLYTIREQLQKDFFGTLKQVAEIGYTWLETANYKDGLFYGMDPGEFKALVEDLGMKCISSHSELDSEEYGQALEAHHKLGVSYLVYPSMLLPEKPSYDDYAGKAELLNHLGAICRKEGIKFGYHNHDFEFAKIGDTTGYDILLELTDPELVCFEADIYWMHYAQVDPQQYFSRYPGRFELWHIKDMEETEERGFIEVGAGMIPYQRYFKEEQDVAGVRFFFVEQDTCSMNPLESIAISYAGLQEMLYR